MMMLGLGKIMFVGFVGFVMMCLEVKFGWDLVGLGLDLYLFFGWMVVKMVLKMYQNLK